MSETLEERVNRLERRLAELADLESIRRVLSLYSKTVDARDAAGLAPLLARDVRVQVTPWGVDVRGHDSVMQFFRAYFQSDWKEPRHNRANEVIERDGDGYRAFSYFHETLCHGERSVMGWGTWEDRFVFEDSCWKFGERVITILALTPIDRGWAGPDKIMGL